MTEQIDHSLQDRKHTLFEAAEELFAKRGFEGTSIRLIFQELGRNSAMLLFMPSVFTEALTALIHLDRPVRDDITGRIVDHIMPMVISAGLHSKPLNNV